MPDFFPGVLESDGSTRPIGSGGIAVDYRPIIVGPYPNRLATNVFQPNNAIDTPPFPNIDVLWIEGQLLNLTPSDYYINKAYYDGDHWQEGNGWLGPMPPRGDEDFRRVYDLLKRVFTSTNIIAEVVGRKADAALGREPGWTLHVKRPLEPGEKPTTEEAAAITDAEAALKSWWKNKHIHQLLQRLCITVLLGGRAPVRLFVPEGYIDANGQVLVDQGSPTALEDAFQAIFIHDPDPSQAGVLVNRMTMQQMGVYIHHEPNGTTSAELMFVERDPNDLANPTTRIIELFRNGTVGTSGVVDGVAAGASPGVATISPYANRSGDGGAGSGAASTNRGAGSGSGSANGQAGLNQDLNRLGYRPDALSSFSSEGSLYAADMQLENGHPTTTLPLDGNMLIYELIMPKMITPQVRGLQQAANKALTMMDTNLDIAGFLERTILNGQMPGHYENYTAPGGGTAQRFVRDDYVTGAGSVNFINGIPVYDKDGKLVHFTQPSVNFREPVLPSAFLDTFEGSYARLLGECQQLHYLSSAGSQYASGDARIQSRAEFEDNLKKVKVGFDDLLTWLMETGLKLAAVFAGTPGRFDELRVVADVRLTPGPPTLQQVKSVIELWVGGLMSRETAMLKTGMIADPIAEGTLIAQEVANGIFPPTLGAGIAAPIMDQNTVRGEGDNLSITNTPNATGTPSGAPTSANGTGGTPSATAVPTAKAPTIGASQRIGSSVPGAQAVPPGRGTAKPRP